MRFWRNNNQIVDNSLDQDKMVLADCRTDAEAQRIVDLLNEMNTVVESVKRGL